MNPSQMPAQMTQEQAVIQIKLRQKNLNKVKELKELDRKTSKSLLDTIDSSLQDLGQVFPADVVVAYRGTIEARLAFLDYELGMINAELEQAAQLLRQADSPILVPSRGGVMSGGSITKL